MRAFRRVPEGLACGLDDWERELLEGDGAKPEDKTEAKAEEPKAEAKKADEAEKSN